MLAYKESIPCGAMSWCLLSSTAVSTLLPGLFSFSTRGRMGLSCNISFIGPSAHMFSLLPPWSSSGGWEPGLGEGEDCEVCDSCEGRICGEDGRWGLMDLGQVHLSGAGQRKVHASFCIKKTGKQPWVHHRGCTVHHVCIRM